MTTQPKERPTDPTIDPFTSKRYILRELARVGDMYHFRLQVPGSGRIQSTDIVFTDDHTAIFGDLCPGRNGVVSSLGYGVEFFSKERSRHYLAEKFLTTGWEPELAHSGLDQMVADEPERFEDDGPRLLRELHSMIDDSDLRGFADWFTERDFESEDVPGWGYNPRDVALLSLINRRFAALYAEHIERGEA